MRVTIEIDEKTGTASTASGESGSSTSAPGAEASAGGSTSAPPAEVLQLAAASGALNGGPAPDIAAATASAPHPFHSRGGAMTEAAHAAAVSGGAAAKH